MTASAAPSILVSHVAVMIVCLTIGGGVGADGLGRKRHLKSGQCGTIKCDKKALETAIEHGATRAWTITVASDVLDEDRKRPWNGAKGCTEEFLVRPRRQGEDSPSSPRPNAFRTLCRRNSASGLDKDHAQAVDRAGCLCVRVDRTCSRKYTNTYTRSAFRTFRSDVGHAAVGTLNALTSIGGVSNFGEALAYAEVHGEARAAPENGGGCDDGEDKQACSTQQVLDFSVETGYPQYAPPRGTNPEEFDYFGQANKWFAKERKLAGEFVVVRAEMRGCCCLCRRSVETDSCWSCAFVSLAFSYGHKGYYLPRDLLIEAGIGVAKRPFKSDEVFPSDGVFTLVDATTYFHNLMVVGLLENVAIPKANYRFTYSQVIGKGRSSYFAARTRFVDPTALPEEFVRERAEIACGKMKACDKLVDAVVALYDFSRKNPPAQIMSKAICEQHLGGLPGICRDDSSLQCLEHHRIRAAYDLNLAIAVDMWAACPGPKGLN